MASERIRWRRLASSAYRVSCSTAAVTPAAAISPAATTDCVSAACSDERIDATMACIAARSAASLPIVASEPTSTSPSALVSESSSERPAGSSKGAQGDAASTGESVDSVSRSTSVSATPLASCLETSIASGVVAAGKLLLPPPSARARSAHPRSHLPPSARARCTIPKIIGVCAADASASSTALATTAM